MKKLKDLYDAKVWFKNQIENLIGTHCPVSCDNADAIKFFRMALSIIENEIDELDVYTEDRMTAPCGIKLVGKKVCNKSCEGCHLIPLDESCIDYLCGSDETNSGRTIIWVPEEEVENNE